MKDKGRASFVDSRQLGRASFVDSRQLFSLNLQERYIINIINIININPGNDKMQNKCTDGNDNTLNGNDIM